MATTFEKRCEILGELWVKHKNNSEFHDFISYNDLGLPLAYSLSTEIVKSTPKAEMFVNETWDILMSALDHKDIGWNSLDELLDGDYPDMDLLEDE